MCGWYTVEVLGVAPSQGQFRAYRGDAKRSCMPQPPPDMKQLFMRGVVVIVEWPHPSSCGLGRRVRVPAGLLVGMVHVGLARLRELTLPSRRQSVWKYMLH